MSEVECFNCKQTGHIARNCTEPRRVTQNISGRQEGQRPSRVYNNSSRSRSHQNTFKCYRCNGAGHLARDCKETEDICFSCQQPGHIARDCPSTRSEKGEQPWGQDQLSELNSLNPELSEQAAVAVQTQAPPARQQGRGGRQSNLTCHSCGRVGHISRNCRSRNKSCFACGSSEHMSRDCPEAGTGEERRRVCFKCKSADHLSRDCPQNVEERAGQNNTSPVCNRCQKPGHIARSCPQCFTCRQFGHIARECEATVITAACEELDLNAHSNQCQVNA